MGAVWWWFVAVIADGTTEPHIYTGGQRARVSVRTELTVYSSGVCKLALYTVKRHIGVH